MLWVDCLCRKCALSPMGAYQPEGWIRPQNQKGKPTVRLVIIAGDETLTACFTNETYPASDWVNPNNDDEEVVFDGDVELAPSEALNLLEGVVLVRGDL